MMNTNSTHKFPRLLPGMAMVPASRGSPRGCSEATLVSGPETAVAMTGTHVFAAVAPVLFGATGGYIAVISLASAAVAAARGGAPDPLVYVEAELARHGGLPPCGASVPAVLADARTAMMLAVKPHEPVMAA